MFENKELPFQLQLVPAADVAANPEAAPGYTSPASSMSVGAGKMGHPRTENIANRMRRLRRFGGLDELDQGFQPLCLEAALDLSVSNPRPSGQVWLPQGDPPYGGC